MMSDRALIDAELRSLTELADEEDTLEDTSGQQLLDLGGQLNLKLGGIRPTDSEIRIKAISRPVYGQLGDESDDDTITVLVTARNAGIYTVPKRDGDGRVIAKTRRHVLEPVAIHVISTEDAERLLAG
jgi:hypothetical protein